MKLHLLISQEDVDRVRLEQSD